MSEEVNLKNKPSSKLIDKKKYDFDFDELKLFFSKPYMIKMKNDRYIEISQPSIGDILELGDREVYSCISPFVNNTTSCRVQLWDIGVDWNKITDYELFTTLIPSVKDVEFLFKIVDFVKNTDYDKKITGEEYIKIYKDIDFSKLKPYVKINNDNKENEKEIILYDPEQEYSPFKRKTA